LLFPYAATDSNGISLCCYRLQCYFAMLLPILMVFPYVATVCNGISLCCYHLQCYFLMLLPFVVLFPYVATVCIAVIESVGKNIALLIWINLAIQLQLGQSLLEY
jgi:hypothetical protein